jgi:hypothetical protein
VLGDRAGERENVGEILKHPKAMAAMMKMVKFDTATWEAAAKELWPLNTASWARFSMIDAVTKGSPTNREWLAFCSYGRVKATSASFNASSVIFGWPPAAITMYCLPFTV